MKRDMDLVRQILLNFEAPSQKHPRIGKINIDGYDRREIDYHVRLLYDAGLISRFDRPDLPVDANAALMMTWKGHDFLDAARDDTIWKNTLNRVGESVASVPFDVLVALLVQALRSAVGLDQ
jgi:DNA-binding transcriptional ArsR family regulator